MKITKEQLAGMIDHSLLKPQSTREELRKLCAEAVTYGFKAVCVNPVHVADAAALLKGEKPLICSVVGFPFGTHTPAAKSFETAEVVRLGAKEVDMVLWIGALKEGRNDEVTEDIAAVGPRRRRLPGQGDPRDLLPHGGGKGPGLPAGREGRSGFREDLHRLWERRRHGRRSSTDAKNRGRGGSASRPRAASGRWPTPWR